MMMWPWPDGDPTFHARRPSPQAENRDVRLTYEVAYRLSLHPATRKARLTVEVQAGVVLLEGVVGSAAVKKVAADTARGTPGVREVCNTVRVVPVDAPTPSEAAEADWSGGDSDDVSDLFDRLVAEVAAERSAAPVTSRRWARISLGAGVAVGWAILSVLIVVLGWVGVIIGCLIASVALTVVNAVRDRRRRTAASYAGDDRTER